MERDQIEIRRQEFGTVQAIVTPVDAAFWRVNLRDRFGVCSDWNFRGEPQPEDLRAVVAHHVRLSMVATRRN